jgi:hypothetical protein
MRLVIGLLGSLFVGLVFGLAVWPVFGLGEGLKAGLVAGLGGALIGGSTGYSVEITTTEMVRWSWLRFLSELFLPSAHELRGLLKIVTFCWLLSGLAVGLDVGLGRWLFFGRGVGLAQGLVSGLLEGLGAGLAMGMIYGGRACLQHLALRLGLRYNGFAPWRYVDFLDYAAERIFLRKVGGGYSFIHRLLQDYFAAFYMESPLCPPPTTPTSSPSGRKGWRHRRGMNS